MPSPPTATGDDELIQNAVSTVIRTCDIVFGATATALAVLGMWFLIAGEERAMTAIALWVFVGFNLTWSLVERWHSVTGELRRAVICLPVASYLYVAEPSLFPKLWIPALMMAVGVTLSTGVESRRVWPGVATTLGYSAGLLLASALALHRVDPDTLFDALGIGLAGIITSRISFKLGLMLEGLRRQRDEARQQKQRAERAMVLLTQRSHELSSAADDLANEMERRVHVESELRQAQKLEAVGRLAAGIAHEINTPVQFVSDSLDFVRDSVVELLGATSQLEGAARAVLDGAPAREAVQAAIGAAEALDLPYLQKNVPRALDRAHEGLSRVATIVRSMKEFAHPDTREMQHADLNRAIEGTLIIARNEYKHVAEIETELAELPPVRCHVGELNQAVLNIVVNAAHAIDDVVTGKATMGRIRVATRRNGDDVVIAISDTGGGIPPEIQDRIFDPFFTTKPVGRGTGQGLAVAHSVIVDKHHGALSFTTELGKGTTFELRLPIEGDAHSIGTEARAAGDAEVA